MPESRFAIPSTAHLTSIICSSGRLNSERERRTWHPRRPPRSLVSAVRTEGIPLRSSSLSLRLPSSHPKFCPSEIFTTPIFSNSSITTRLDNTQSTISRPRIHFYTRRSAFCLNFSIILSGTHTSPFCTPRLPLVTPILQPRTHPRFPLCGSRVSREWILPSKHLRQR